MKLAADKIKKIEEYKKPKKKRSELRSWIDAIAFAIVVGLIIRAFVFEIYRVPTPSMHSTILVGDRIFVSKLAYKLAEPQRNDIIVFIYPLQPNLKFVKRLVGMPGDTIKIDNKQLYINGEQYNIPAQRFQDSFLVDPQIAFRDTMPEFVIPEGHYFMMGDNRDNSEDSRFWGLVERDKLLGKAKFVFWSTGKGELFRFDRLFDSLYD